MFSYAYDCYLKRKYPAWALLAVIKYIEGLASKTTEDHHTYNTLVKHRQQYVKADEKSEEGSLGKCVMVTMSIVAHNRVREIFSKIHETKICLPKKYFVQI